MHDFLLKAKANPDLDDFCEYLEKPLQILQELEYRYKHLPLDKKVKHDNMVTHLKIDKILNEYLPNMVDNYCDFSLQYRNEFLIKKENTKDGEKSYTAKDLLLKNLAKIIEEINLLEEEFNGNNKFQLLVQEKILTDLGHTVLDMQPQLELKNKAKYNNIFKIPEVKVPPVNQPENKNVSIDKNKEEDLDEALEEEIYEEPHATQDKPLVKKATILRKKMFSMMECGMILTVLCVGASMGLWYYESSAALRETATAATHIKSINYGIKSTYEANYGNIARVMLDNPKVIPRDMRANRGYIYSQWGNVRLAPTEDNKKFTMTYENVPLSQCKLLVEKTIIMDFSQVIVNNTAVKSPEKQYFNHAELDKNCFDKNQIIFTSS